MSNGYFSSFTSNNGFDRSYYTSYGSNQSTEATEVSESGTPGGSTRQVRSTAAEEGVFQNVGYGVGQFGVAATNPNTAFGNNYGYPTANPTTPGYTLQTQTRSVYEEPWSPLVHQFGPYAAIQRATAPGPGQLKHPVYTAYGYQPCAVPSTPSVGDSWGRQRSVGITSSGSNQNSTVSQQYTTSSSSGQSGKVPIARLPPSPQTRETSSDDVEPKPRYWCQVPGCGTSCSRADDLARHVRTRHTQGPYWLCNMCGHWEYNERLDKMREHCRNTPGHGTAQGQSPYRQVESVGQQNHVARVSTDGKLTRRRKRRLT